MMVCDVFLGRLPRVRAESRQVTEDRDVSLTIPARPDHLVLARLALSAVCRLTPLPADEVADPKLAVTEAANDYVDDARPDEQEGRLNRALKLLGERVVHELEGPSAEVSAVEHE